MSRRVINCAKLCLSHPFDRIKWIRQWAVDRDPVLTSTTSAKIGKTAIPTRELSVYARRSGVRTAFWRFVASAKYVGCRFRGIIFYIIYFSLSLCFFCGAVRRARPGKDVSMYMTSFAASQNSKFSIAEALAIGTESIAPVLGHGRIVSCHSPVAQIKKRGATVRLHVPAFFRLMQASRLLQSAQFFLSGSEQNEITTDSQPSIWPDRCCWRIGFRPDCILFGLRTAKLSRLQ